MLSYFISIYSFIVTLKCLTENTYFVIYNYSERFLNITHRNNWYDVRRIKTRIELKMKCACTGLLGLLLTLGNARVIISLN